MKQLIKQLHWKEVMVGAVTILVSAFLLSSWAILHAQPAMAVLGLSIMATVCVSWWFWVMFVIRTVLRFHQNTLEHMEDFCVSIKEIKEIVQAEINTDR